MWHLIIQKGLSSFDLWMYYTFGFYGRYVDDFFIITPNKEQTLQLIPYFRTQLKLVLNVELHPDKFYCQPVSRGGKFIGSVVKKDRLYVGNQTVSNFVEALHALDPDNVDRAVNSINSYLGFMKHYRSFKIKRQMFDIIDKIFGDKVQIHLDKISNPYKHNLIIE